MKNEDKVSVVIGASPNQRRYSNAAVLRLSEAGYTVYPIGIRNGAINGIQIIKGMPNIKDVHTVTLYISAIHQPQYYDYIIKLKPKRLIFNPGTYNPEFKEMSIKAGISVISDCTLVMISMGLY